MYVWAAWQNPGSLKKIKHVFGNAIIIFKFYRNLYGSGKNLKTIKNFFLDKQSERFHKYLRNFSKIFERVKLDFKNSKISKKDFELEQQPNIIIMIMS